MEKHSFSTLGFKAQHCQNCSTMNLHSKWLGRLNCLSWLLILGNTLQNRLDFILDTHFSRGIRFQGSELQFQDFVNPALCLLDTYRGFIIFR